MPRRCVGQEGITVTPAFDWHCELIPADHDLLTRGLWCRMLRGRRPIQSCGGDVAGKQRYADDDHTRSFHLALPCSIE